MADLKARIGRKSYEKHNFLQSLFKEVQNSGYSQVEVYESGVDLVWLWCVGLVLDV